jgi:hypothetical protein
MVVKQKKKKKQYNPPRDENFRTLMPDDGKTLPPGRYYIGDLCYVMRPEWPEVVTCLYPDHLTEEMKEGVHTLMDGRKFAIYSTAYGDGTYNSSVATTFDVDSGTIGAILVQDITDEEVTPEWMAKVGGIFDFRHRLETSSNNGTLEFGRVVIFTSDDIEYQESDQFWSGY